MTSVERYLEYNNTLPVSQNGSQQGKITIDTVTNLITDNQCAFPKNSCYFPVQSINVSEKS